MDNKTSKEMSQTCLKQVQVKKSAEVGYGVEAGILI